jgi:hypothetical protein
MLTTIVPADAPAAPPAPAAEPNPDLLQDAVDSLFA